MWWFGGWSAAGTLFFVGCVAAQFFFGLDELRTKKIGETGALVLMVAIGLPFVLPILILSKVVAFVVALFRPTD